MLTYVGAFETGTALSIGLLPPASLASTLSIVKRRSLLDCLGSVQASIGKEAALQLANHT